MNPKWLRFAADLLRLASCKFSNHGCNDMNWPADWSEADRVEFIAMMDRHEGGPSGMRPDDTLMDWLAMDCLADELEEVAREAVER